MYVSSYLVKVCLRRISLKTSDSETARPHERQLANCLRSHRPTARNGFSSSSQRDTSRSYRLVVYGGHFGQLHDTGIVQRARLVTPTHHVSSQLLPPPRESTSLEFWLSRHNAWTNGRARKPMMAHYFIGFVNVSSGFC